MPAGTILVRDAIWRYSALVGDYDPQYQMWPEVETVNWFNDAALAINKFVPSACSRVDAIKLRAGTFQSIEAVAAADCKPGDGTTPSAVIRGTLVLDVICNMGSDGLTPGKAIRMIPRAREALDTETPLWHTLTSGTIDQWLFDPRTPRVFYVSKGVTGTVWARVAYNAQPIPIPAGGEPGAELYLVGGSNTATIPVSDEHIDDLVNYAVARAKMKAKDYGDNAGAQVYGALFVNSINAKVAAVTGSNPNLKQLPFAPTPLGQAS